MSAVSEEDYGALDISDVTSDDTNANILRCLKTDANKRFVALGQLNERYRASHEYIPEDARSMGAFGYYVGRCTNIAHLTVQLQEEVDHTLMESFLCGLRNNRSIGTLDLICSYIPRDFFQMLTPFMSSNPNLESITVDRCEMDVEQFRSLSVALREGSNSLKKLMIGGHADGDFYHEESIIANIDALKMHPQLEDLSFSRFAMGRNACAALADLLRQSAAGMKSLALCNNDIDDTGVEALFEGLAYCRSLERLQLARNPSIAAKEWRVLASLLEDPNFSLRFLNLGMNGIDNESAAIFANALARNNTLEELYFDCDANITSDGWAPFSKVLCDTSSVSSTFLSNHTLRRLTAYCERDVLPGDVASSLFLNNESDKRAVACRKILRHHDDFNMQPLFEWDLKVLPFVLNWFERAATYAIESEAGNQKRKLSAIHQFIRGMPELAIDGITGVNKKSAKVGGGKRLHSAAFEG